MNEIEGALVRNPAKELIVWRIDLGEAHVGNRCVANLNWIKLVDLKGGNVGLQVGAQSYSQVTYILTEARYQEVLQNNRMSLDGSISYGLRGHLQNSRLSSDAFKGDLFTVVFNETGTVYGASLESLYCSL